MAELLESEKFYHLYNHANGNDILFKTDENYNFFLKKYRTYIEPIADTYAYCLMPNHFHFLVKIKNLEQIVTFPKFETLEKFSDLEKFSGLEKYISKQFSNLFSSYTQAFNKLYNRQGSLFLKNFKRKNISSDSYLRQVIVYIHNNPLKHEFVKKPEQWKYSSYSFFLSKKQSIIKKDEVISLFEDIDNFKYYHKKQGELIAGLQIEE